MSRIGKGTIPIISHTALNNGISNWTCKIENRKLFDHRRTISLADRGNFKAFVQKQDFYIGTRVKALEVKNTISYYSLIYLALLIDKQAVKFSYGHNACDNTENIFIEVPVKNNKIDYDYMENYIKNRIVKKYHEYIRFLKNKVYYKIV